MAAKRERWRGARDLFDRIRQKTMVAERQHDRVRLAQYLFEEACAKTLYNLSGSSAPFDMDSPYWVVPSALVLASFLGIDAKKVAEIVMDSPRFSPDNWCG